MKRQITIKDIASKLGLSPSTISRALDDHPHVNKKTKQKVKDTATKLGYQYNAVAAGLRKNKSNTIGLIVPRISKYYQSAVITAIQNRLHDSRYNLIICQSNESVQLEKELVNALYASRVEGLLVSSTLHTEEFSHFDVFSRSNTPIVFFDRVPTNYPCHKIEGNDYQGGYSATIHLLEQGCKRIAHIGGTMTCSIYRDRFNGYKDAMEEYGLPIEEDLIFFHDLIPENALTTARKLFTNRAPDGIFACNDTTAIAVMQYAQSIHISIPEQLKVIGFSNDPSSEIINPTLSSIEQYPSKVGMLAADMMLDLIHQRKKPGKRFLTEFVTIDLVRRNSTARYIAYRREAKKKLKIAQ